jgi:hypothetical protein
VISTLVTLVPTLKDAAADVLRVVHDLPTSYCQNMVDQDSCCDLL